MTLHEQKQERIPWEGSGGCWPSVTAAAIQALSRNQETQPTGAELARQFDSDLLPSLLFTTGFIIGATYPDSGVGYSACATYATEAHIQDLIRRSIHAHRLLALPVFFPTWAQEVLRYDPPDGIPAESHAILLSDYEESDGIMRLSIMDPFTKHPLEIPFDWVYPSLLTNTLRSTEQPIFLCGEFFRVSSAVRQGIFSISGPEDLMQHILSQFQPESGITVRIEPLAN